MEYQNGPSDQERYDKAFSVAEGLIAEDRSYLQRLSDLADEIDSRNPAIGRDFAMTVALSLACDEPAQTALPTTPEGVGEVVMHYGECQLWVQALEWFIREHGLKVPTWATMIRMGWKSKPSRT